MMHLVLPTRPPTHPLAEMVDLAGFLARCDGRSRRSRGVRLAGQVLQLLPTAPDLEPEARQALTEDAQAVLAAAVESARRADRRRRRALGPAASTVAGGFLFVGLLDLAWLNAAPDLSLPMTLETEDSPPRIVLLASPPAEVVHGVHEALVDELPPPEADPGPPPPSNLVVPDSIGVVTDGAPPPGASVTGESTPMPDGPGVLDGTVVAHYTEGPPPDVVVRDWARHEEPLPQVTDARANLRAQDQQAHVAMDRRTPLVLQAVEAPDTHEETWVGATEVTQRQWMAVMGLDLGGLSGRWDQPVEPVSWCDALRFANGMSERERLKPVYQVGADCEAGGTVRWNTGAGGYRLLTEAEWTSLAAGSDSRTAVTARTNNRGIVPVYGAGGADAHGIVGLASNVGEWVWGTPEDPDRRVQVHRGGESHAVARSCLEDRAECRRVAAGGELWLGVGLRVARGASMSAAAGKGLGQAPAG